MLLRRQRRHRKWAMAASSCEQHIVLSADQL
jgi:hypothetical protein